MKILNRIVVAVTLLAAAVVGDDKVIGPFALRVTGKTNSNVDGYVWACHAGAATEGLCYAAGSSAVSGAEYEFYYNYTVYGNDSYPGFVSYVLTYVAGDGSSMHVPSFLRIVPSWSSNVHLALIPPGIDGGTPLSLDFDTGHFHMGPLYDDSHWNATAPFGEPGVDLANFQICYQWTGGYWYQSLGWVSGLPGAVPQNPSCQPVNLGVESLKGS